jgi:hypothetical protein
MYYNGGMMKNEKQNVCEVCKKPFPGKYINGKVYHVGCALEILHEKPKNNQEPS